MKKILVSLLFVAVLFTAFTAVAQDDVFVKMDTSKGEILIHMRPDLAVNHVANFMHLVETGFYNGTAFHRVIPGFMIQGGDPNSKDEDRRNDGQGGPLWKDVVSAGDAALLSELSEKLESRGYAGMNGQASLIAEFNNEPHVRGTLSMARSQHPDSAGSQFFLCVARAASLDKQYTNFGKIVYGLEVIDEIVNTPRDRYDNPHEKVVIKDCKILYNTYEFSEEELAAWAEMQVNE
ncbi:peptidylprolyl isomerase [bacterium]|nr:peptidylprolyl isomerase [bacterium]